MKTVSVNWAIGQILATCQFLLIPSPQTSLGTFILIILHFSATFKISMEYVQIRMENIYLLIENMWKSYGGMMETLRIEA